MRTFMFIIERLAPLAVLFGITMAIAAGIWTGLSAKFDEKVDKEVDRRIRNMRIITHVNVGVDVIEDPLNRK